jgi:cysteine desulfurase
VAHEHGIPVHSDAVQAIGAIDVDFGALQLDALTVSSHKVGGPLGVGALVVARGVTPEPLLHGGAQERLRSGTLDAPAICAFAAALRTAIDSREQSAVRIAALRDHLVAGVLDRIPDAVVMGDLSPGGRLPGHVGVRAG